MITKSASDAVPVGPVLLTPEVFRQHREEVIKEMGTKAVSKTVGEILYRVSAYRVGKQIPAGMVMPLRVSLRPDYLQWLKAEYFLRPIEGTASHGLVVELILIWDPSDQELDLLANILVPHVAEFATVANSILGRIAQPKYKLLDEKLTASVLRARVLKLVALITTKALLLRSSGTTS
jgi:hypothetical protein